MDNEKLPVTVTREDLSDVAQFYVVIARSGATVL